MTDTQPVEWFTQPDINTTNSWWFVGVIRWTAIWGDKSRERVMDCRPMPVSVTLLQTASVLLVSVGRAVHNLRLECFNGFWHPNPMPPIPNEALTLA